MGGMSEKSLLTGIIILAILTVIFLILFIVFLVLYLKNRPATDDTSLTSVG